MTFNQADGLLLMATRYPQMGAHSGYHMLAEALPAFWPGRTEIIYRRYGTLFGGITHKLVQPFLKRRGALPAYNYLSLLLELQAAKRFRRGGIGVAHMMFLDNDFHYLKRRRRRGVKLVGSVHLPSAVWRSRHPDSSFLREFDGIICMSSEQVGCIRDFFDGPIDVQRLGLDIDFFSPGENEKTNAGPPRFLCCGTHLRDFATLAAVIESARARIPDLQFDLVTAEWARRDPALQAVAKLSYVRWHERLSDAELRNLYRQSLALVLPLRDTAANNVVCEAMACGLPIIATDLPGVRDYTRPEFATYISACGVEEFVAAMERFAKYPELAQAQGKAARALAEATLGLPTVATAAVDFYQKILHGPKIA